MEQPTNDRRHKLVLLLQAEDAEVREAAADALGALGDIEAVEPLISLIADRYAPVQYAAIQALGRLGGSRAFEAVAKMLRDPDRERLHGAAVRSLGQMGQMGHGAAAVQEIAPVAQRRAGDSIGNQAIEILGAIGHPTAIEVLSRFFRFHGPSSDLSWDGTAFRIARALTQVMAKNNDVDGLKRCLSMGSSYELREAAATALGKVGDPRAAVALLTALHDKRGVPQAAAEALGELGSEALPPLVDALRNAQDRDPDHTLDPVRGYVAIALGRLGDQRAVPALARSLNLDWNLKVRLEAAKALGEIGGSSAVFELSRVRNYLDSLKKPDPRVRLEAAKVLSEIGGTNEVLDLSRVGSYLDALNKTIDTALKAAQSKTSDH